MQLEVILVVLGYDLQSKHISFLLNNSSSGLLSAIIDEGSSSLDIASELLGIHTGCRGLIGGVGWVHLKQLPIIDNADRIIDGERWVAVPYVCVIPKEVNLLEDEWVDIMDTSKLSPEECDILRLACNERNC